MSSLVKDRVLKRILMVGTGGTIACKSSEDGLKPLLTSEELLRYVPDTKEFCKVDSLQVINIDSTNMQPRYWLMIAETIEKYYEDYDGFVVCHGDFCGKRGDIRRNSSDGDVKICKRYSNKGNGKL